MIAIRIEEPPQIKGIIHPMEGRIVGKIEHTSSQIKGIIFPVASYIKGTVTKDTETEPYYEVSNVAGGFTIFIGE